MSGGMEQLVVSGPLLLAMPVAAAAGAVTFLSPCVLPLVPGYLSYVTGMSGAVAESSAARQAKRSDPSPTGTGAAQVAASAVTSAGTAGAAGTPAGTLVGTEAHAAEAGPPAPAVPAATDAPVQGRDRHGAVRAGLLRALRSLWGRLRQHRLHAEGARGSSGQGARLPDHLDGPAVRRCL